MQRLFHYHAEKSCKLIFLFYFIASHLELCCAVRSALHVTEQTTVLEDG